jgi:hypothetical protein
LTKLASGVISDSGMPSLSVRIDVIFFWMSFITGPNVEKSG